MGEEDRTIDTGGGAYIEGEVNTGGDFIGRDKVDTLIQRLEQKTAQRDYVEHQEITQVFLVVPGAQEEVVKWLAKEGGVDSESVAALGVSAAPGHIQRQIEEVELAQREAEAGGVGLEPGVAYQFGLLAAYRRDYEAALAYLRRVTQDDPEFTKAYEAIAWIQQSLAMADLGRGDYRAAKVRLAEARSAAALTDPLDARGLAMRGYIAKTMAQIAEHSQEQDKRNKYYAEAGRMFKGALGLNPSDAGAWNGLGNVDHAKGNLDEAINAYQRAIDLEPKYIAAYHDLAIAYEGKMRTEPESSAGWCQKALEAWRETYHLAPNDPGFTSEDITRIGQRILSLEGYCG
jgi:tetratricopeptide (TPR) repeat protein